MAHQRKPSIASAPDQNKEPHPISLKVLRLSRPTLTSQHPLPIPTVPLASTISPTASVSYPSVIQSPHPNAFLTTPLLTLPPAFGNAYVGETFSCTLCANNELPPDSTTTTPAISTSDNSPISTTATKRLTNVRIEAEMKTPSQTLPLEVAFSSSISNKIPTDSQSPTTIQLGPSSDLNPGSSLQGIITFHLREEGPHVLAVTISYNENSATSGRVRTFRKLYQFVARPCLVVRTKISSFAGGGKKGRWALEAQLENVGEDAIVLTGLGLETKAWCRAGSLNWDGLQAGENPILSHGDVQQVCFLVEQGGGGNEEEKLVVDAAGRLVMGILNIAWRGEMGNLGSLSTGWLGVKT